MAEPDGVPFPSVRLRRGIVLAQELCHLPPAPPVLRDAGEAVDALVPFGVLGWYGRRLRCRYPLLVRRYRSALTWDNKVFDT